MDPQAQGRHVTHPNLHIKTAHDAHVLFEAVRQGHLPMIRRRLSGGERAQLRSGDVFVWEEAPHKGGLERWTDGRKWSASRMREPFLFYEEKVARKGPYDYNSTSPMPSPSLPGVPSPSPFAQQQHSPSSSSPTTSPSTINGFHHFSHSADIGSGGFTKQTYSAWVTFPIPEGTPPENLSAYKKKWHLTAYFSSADFSSLPGVQDDPLLRTIRVPTGMYETGKGLMRKAPSKESRPPPPTIPMTYGDGGRCSVPGPYGYAPGPHTYHPTGPTATHGHGKLRYVIEEDDRDDAMSIDGESYPSYPRERASSSTSRAQGGGEYYGAGPLPPSYDSRHHYHYQQPSPAHHHAHNYAGRPSYDQHHHERDHHHHHRAVTSTYDERDLRDRRDCFLRPGSPNGSRSPGEDERDIDGDEGDDFDRDKDNEDLQAPSQPSLSIASPPPPPPHAHYRSSRRREEDSSASTASPASSSPSAIRYYGEPDLKWAAVTNRNAGASRSAGVRGRSMSMSLALPPPPPLFSSNESRNQLGNVGGRNVRSIESESASETPPGPILTPISAGPVTGGFPPNLHQPHQQFQRHQQQHHASSSPRRDREREREREGERDQERYHGPYAPLHHFAMHTTSGNGGNPYYTPASLLTNASSSSCGAVSISNVRTGSGSGPGNADRNGDMREYFPFVPVASNPSSSTSSGGPVASDTAQSSSASSPVIVAACTKEASYPSPPPERGGGSGSGSGSGASSQRGRDIPGIGSLASGNGAGGSGSAGGGANGHRSAEDQKALGAFIVAL